MSADIAAAALASENRHLANPCSIDSIPTGAGQEDHVSMSAHGAWRLHRMVGNLERLLAIEWIAASAGVEQRAPRQTGAPLRRVVSTLRTEVSPLAADRALADDIEAARGLLRGGTLLEACEPCRLPPLEVSE